MVKRIIVIIGLIIVCLLPSVSLSCSSNMQVSLGHEFILGVGQTAEVIGESLTVKFVEVTADSRCPNGAQCIWAGEATCRMEITLNGVTSENVFTISGGISSNAEAFFDKYTFDFTLEPYPEVDEDITPSDYRLIMTIYS
jgi:hypothetical protein